MNTYEVNLQEDIRVFINMDDAWVCIARAIKAQTAHLAS